MQDPPAIEQDANVVGLLYKPGSDVVRAALLRLKEEEEDAVPVNLLVAQHQNGPTGDVHLTF